MQNDSEFLNHKTGKPPEKRFTKKPQFIIDCHNVTCYIKGK
ncbi:conserved hypothetical protein [delta proteobacterium NaphS2]|nr:conserved hypothetical protein [delta proteobacterium NaphS2]